MLLNSVTPNVVNYQGYSFDQGPKTYKEKVDDAAAVTGGVGAGVAATRSSGAFKYFKSSEKLRGVVDGAAKTTEALTTPAKQSKSLWNALKLNYKNLTTRIANWAKASKMPKFMKALFTGKLGKAIGGVAAVFVFISGVGEVARTLVNNISKIGSQVSAATEYPYA